MSSRYEDGLRAMLIRLEPIVRDRMQAETARNPDFAMTQGIVVADASTKWGRLFAVNVLGDDPPTDAVATIATVELDVLRNAFHGDERVLEMIACPSKPGFALLVVVGEGSGGTIGIVVWHVPIAKPAPAVMRVN